jgi:hypothetical protein
LALAAGGMAILISILMSANPLMSVNPSIPQAVAEPSTPEVEGSEPDAPDVSHRREDPIVLRGRHTPIGCLTKVRC